MIRLNKKLFNATTLAGLVLTLGVIAADWFGLLDAVERGLYDMRAARCQIFMPPPTDKLVHIDIDDAALESIQRWPWDRSIMARIMDELALAKPSAVALDIMLPEPQKPEWQKQPDGSFKQIDHDALFAKSLANLGTAIVPASFTFPTERVSPLFLAVRDLMIDDLELDSSEVTARLRAAGWNDPKLAAEVDADTIYLIARRSAMYRRIQREISKQTLSDDALQQRVLPKSTPGMVSPMTRLFTLQLARVRAAIALRKLVPPVRPGETPSAFQTRLTNAPLAAFAEAAGTTGFVDYPQAFDGRTRSVPLFITAEGRLYPQLGFSLACASMGVKLDDIKLTASSVTIPRPGKSALTIPTRTLHASELDRIRDVPLSIDLRAVGTADWRTMYAGPGRPADDQHLPIVRIWDACRTQDRITENNVLVDQAVLALYEGAGEAAKVKELELRPLAAGETDARVKVVKKAVEDNAFFAEGIAQLPDAERDNQSKAILASYKAAQEYLAQVPLLESQLAENRKYLSDTLKGRAALVGWTASGASDYVPTSLHAKCPGVVLHGVVFNGILTGEVWRALPIWLTLLITLLVGFLATAAVSYLSPLKALVSSVLMIAAYIAINGVLLFDYGNMILGAAGPLTAIGLVWSGGTLTRLILEQRHRALIRKRFRTYVDPRLVDYVERHPEQAGFEGERREMTVVFTDLVGFTKLTEAMGEDTVKVLNRLWARMVPIVRRHGYLNKFLGDGIMFFYGAPEVSSDHATAAVYSILEMRDVMTDFNRETSKEGLPELGMRFGVSTGDMIVGDAGAGEAGSDYTVLGDNVNLGSRLEGANKATGTTNCVTARTAELAADAFLFRPIGKLRVVGKQQGVMTYEALCFRETATDERKKLVAMTTTMVEAYQAQRLPECIEAANQLDKEFGASKLAALYRRLSEAHLNNPDAEPFDGLITLTEK